MVVRNLGEGHLIVYDYNSFTLSGKKARCIDEQDCSPTYTALEEHAQRFFSGAICQGGPNVSPGLNQTDSYCIS